MLTRTPAVSPSELAKRMKGRKPPGPFQFGLASVILHAGACEHTSWRSALKVLSGNTNVLRLVGLALRGPIQTLKYRRVNVPERADAHARSLTGLDVSASSSTAAPQESS